MDYTNGVVLPVLFTEHRNYRLNLLQICLWIITEVSNVTEESSDKGVWGVLPQKVLKKECKIVQI